MDIRLGFTTAIRPFFDRKNTHTSFHIILPLPEVTRISYFYISQVFGELAIWANSPKSLQRNPELHLRRCRKPFRVGAILKDLK